MPKWSQHRPRVGSGDLGLRDAGVSDSVDAGDHSAVVPRLAPEGTVYSWWIHIGAY